MAGKHSKPNFSESMVREILKKRFDVTASEIHSLPSYDDQNFYVVPAEGNEYLLKILNSEDSKNVDLTEVQTFAMSFLQEKGFPTQTALPSTSGQLMCLEEADCGYGVQKYLVRLLTYLPGTTVSKIDATPELLFEIGKMAATMDKAFQEMKHPKIDSLEREKFIWSLTNVPLLEEYLHLLDGEPLQEVVKAVIQQYKTSVVPQRSKFRKGINHGDVRDINLIVQPDEKKGHRISGIIDFGHMHAGYYIHELAVNIMYMMIGHSNPIEAAAQVLAGWESVLPLTDAEKDCLYVLVLSRFCQALIMARHTVKLQPENKEYLMRPCKAGAEIITHMWNLGKEQVEKVWFESVA